MPKPDKLKVEQVLLTEIHPAPQNARIHDARNVDAIAASLQAHGQVLPILVRVDGEIIGGHGTKTAMEQLGWESCRISRVDVTDEEAKALALRLNRSAELGSWHEELLIEQANSLVDFGVGLDELGWTTEELDTLSAGAAGLAEGGGESASASTLGDGGDAPLMARIRLTIDQRGVFDEAWKKMQAAEGDDPPLSEGRCVEFLSADWSSGH